MKRFSSFLALIASLVAIPLHGITITYDLGYTNTQNSSGPAWVSGSTMFLEIIEDFTGAPGPSGATASSHVGFNLFEPGPGGGGMDIGLLSWRYGPMTLAQGGDAVTLSPGADTPGFEDYRYDTQGGAAAPNLTFFYDGAQWASGYVTQFIVEVDNDADASASGSGTAVLTSNTVVGQDFMNEIMAASGGTGSLVFEASNFAPVVFADPGTFSSAGTITVIPEPSTGAFLGGLTVLLAVALRRRRAA